MEEFTAYLFGPDGHIVQRVSLICADEDAAKERAEQPAETYAVELWQLARKIASYPPRGQ
ncbi:MULTISPECIES: hypothetical protein [Bradyrhizobium]|jgi:hypothetical protein|uniref:hypothetical protein n=1 Tax=Bradyrhizobium TaxID=374 RepID=UPI00057DB2EB|nr:hypothetical protein [Bradyrhizobium japonicum]MBR0735275.1 hypothetical protein [Bradyrhizobium japonicum]MBR0914345.1 hypothetical protein [Bradyrhizobium japonicum]MCD9113292.1 hypothetical protein [Bradyrhizobium japonicum]MCD9260746.1 hypothetical protein [Bradyrhizobium japonicum SEMIA 5079]MCD9825704.1 hypothetical protein [Bradyrhizobium japonicum]